MSRFLMEVDRIAPRGRPRGNPVMHQRWKDVLFMHWPVSTQAVRALVPPQLELDLFEGEAWISVTPLHMEDVRPIGVPPLLGTSVSEEVNVRTYVTHLGMPGVWFFSLDASKTLPVMAARVLLGLPYHKARVRFNRPPDDFRVSLLRTTHPRAELEVSWTVGARLRDPAVRSLAFFLSERYCLFIVEDGVVRQLRIHHHPWILDEAFPAIIRSSMISSLGLREPTRDPLAHFAREQDVEVWPPKISRPRVMPAAKLPKARPC